MDEFMILISSSRNLTKPRAELARIQNRKIRNIVDYAYRKVHFYHRLLKDNGIQLGDIKSVKDLNRIPVITKEDLKRVNTSDLISSDYRPEKLNTLKTGGSTGEPLSTYISDHERNWRTAIYLRCNIKNGQRPWHSWASLDEATHLRKQRHGVRFFPHTSVPIVWSLSRQVEMLQALRPDVLDGLSSTLWLLAREVRDGRVASIQPRIVFGTGELISNSSRRLIEDVFGGGYYDQLSCTEVGRTAWECAEREGYHMNVDSCVMQFLGGEGEEVSQGERGEITYTSLHNYAMPIIRYCIHDVGIPMDDECPCGVTMPMMKMIEGRRNSFIVFPSGRIVSPWRLIEALNLFTLTDMIRQYKIIQESRDLIEVRIVKTRQEVDEAKIHDFIKSNLEREFTQEDLDLSELELRITYVDSITRTSRGKLNVVSSKLHDIPIF